MGVGRNPETEGTVTIIAWLPNRARFAPLMRLRINQKPKVQLLVFRCTSSMTEALEHCSSTRF